jgi:DNA-binding transcriptional ArsR family regulator
MGHKKHCETMSRAALCEQDHCQFAGLLARAEQAERAHKVWEQTARQMEVNYETYLRLHTEAERALAREVADREHYRRSEQISYDRVEALRTQLEQAQTDLAGAEATAETLRQELAELEAENQRDAEARAEYWRTQLAQAEQRGRALSERARDRWITMVRLLSAADGPHPVQALQVARATLAAQILAAIRGGGKSAADLAEELDSTRGSVSKELSRLEKRGKVVDISAASQGRGNKAVYALAEKVRQDEP